jgi:transposase InsO family protein
VKHPRANGKIERFSGEVERRIEKFGSIDKIVHWQNEIKPHMSLNLQEPAKYSGIGCPQNEFLDLLRSSSMCK